MKLLLDLHHYSNVLPNHSSRTTSDLDHYFKVKTKKKVQVFTLKQWPRSLVVHACNSDGFF